MKRTYFMAFLLLNTSALFADYITLYEMQDANQTFMYKDASHSKMITQHDDDESAVYKIGKKSYIVNERNGKKTVVDMDEMKAMMNSFGANTEAIKEDIKKKKESFHINKTGKKERVGGVSGELWIISGEDDGEKFEQEVVVSRDKRIAKSMHAMYAMIATLNDGDVDDTMNFLEVEKGYVVIKADGMKLISFTEKSVPDSEYELPKDAKKQKIPNLGNLFGGADKKEDKVVEVEKREKDIDEDSRDEKINKDVDKAVDMLKSFF